MFEAGKLLREQMVQMIDVDRMDERFNLRDRSKALVERAILQHTHMAKNNKWLNGFTTRPILWMGPDGKYVVCDGWIRIQAGVEAKCSQFNADIFQGTETEALLLTVQINMSHGLPLTHPEKLEACRRVVKALTQSDGTQPSHSVVSKRLRVSESAIRKYRLELFKLGQLELPTKVVGKDGKVQKGQKAKWATIDTSVGQWKTTLQPAKKHPTAKMVLNAMGRVYQMVESVEQNAMSAAEFEQMTQLASRIKACLDQRSQHVLGVAA